MPSADLPHVYFNPTAPSTMTTLPDPRIWAFHRRLPGYAVTPLRRAPALATALGVRELWVKDESDRLGLPAYKILGASWAVYQLLERRFGPFAPWQTLDDLAAQLQPQLPLTLVAATNGNHGRAVARMARWLGVQARILVPEDMVPARIQALLSEGAHVDSVPGSYDETVVEAAYLAGDGQLVVNDTVFNGGGDVYTPGWVTEGYSTVFQEIDRQLAEMDHGQPDVVTAQMGVGSLAMAVIQHYRGPGRETRVLGVEPAATDSMLRSLKAGRPVEVSGPHDSVMAEMNSGVPSLLAWPYLRHGLSGLVTITDVETEDAMRWLAREGVVSGTTGAAGVGGLLALLRSELAEETRAALGLTPSSVLLTISTEGATDPEAYARVVGSGLE